LDKLQTMKSIITIRGRFGFIQLILVVIGTFSILFKHGPIIVLHDRESTSIIRDENVFTLYPPSEPPNLKYTGMTNAANEFFCHYNGYWGALNSHGCCRFVRDNFPYEMEFEKLLRKWQNKRILFIGDSMTQQILDALALYLMLNRVQFKYNWPVQIDPNSFVEEFNISISRIGNGGCIHPLNPDFIKGEITPITCKYQSSSVEMESVIRNSDVVYINFGLHIENNNTDSIRSFYMYLRSLLEFQLQLRPNLQVFYRLTFPQNFESMDGKRGTSYTLTSKRNCVAYGVEAQEHKTSRIAREVFYKSTIKILNYHEYLKNRSDLHSHKSGDCSHFCANRQMWRGIWYLMERTLVD